MSGGKLGACSFVTNRSIDLSTALSIPTNLSIPYARDVKAGARMRMAGAPEAQRSLAQRFSAG